MSEATALPPSYTSGSPIRRQRLLVRGLVQGVGFRPFVYRLAQRLHLEGFVQNGPDGVLIEIEGERLERFQTSLLQELPPLARVDSVVVSEIEPELSAAPVGQEFEIRQTQGGQVASAAIPADKGLCKDCLQELFDSTNRRYLHPFIACTNCGPRYSMTRALPYDRSNTSMADFPLCYDCEDEYGDPSDRRFHAEPVCCHHCGPSLSHSAEQISQALRAGKIVAIKGIGGFHLACDARNAGAVNRLRQRKQRDGKPFAVMVLNAASAEAIADLSQSAAALLTSQDRPIVALPGSKGLAAAVSPGLHSVGVMLPYTGLHYLLFYYLLNRPQGREWLDQAAAPALVMTSANSSGNPLVASNSEAQRSLASIADLIVTHDRDISARIDDSVVRLADHGPIWIRRARGEVPNAILLPDDGPVVLGLGAHLKNTVTLARGKHAWLGPHVGDLDTPATIGFHRSSCDELLEIFQEAPAALACDWHRDYASTHLAEYLAEQFQAPLVRVQHHHAHIAAVMADNGHDGPALGIALDGHGQGERGESWGGELLSVSADKFQRLGHLLALPAAGGDVAAREPWRMAAGALQLLGRGSEIESRFADQVLAKPLSTLLQEGEVNSTTAAGRLFDCAAGLLGISRCASFEGEAPMQLEALVSKLRVLGGGYELQRTESGSNELSFLPLLNQLADCDDPALGAELFHGTLIDGLATWTIEVAEQTNIEHVALAGGCFVNRILLDGLAPRLERAGLRVLRACSIPPNDASISLGQAWVARQRLLAGKPKLEVLDLCV